jgi:hypothetical protein
MKRLFLLTRVDYYWDEMAACVVRAESPSAARKLAAEKKGDEGKQLWLDPLQSACKVLDHEGPDGIIIRDFNAG